MRNIINTGEPDWTGAERCWAHVEQYPPRRFWPPVEARLAIYAGMAAALVLIIVETLL